MAAFWHHYRAHVMKKIVFLLFGHFFLLLGIIGIFIPVLPTTPFLLLTAGCFLKGSERLYRWLTEHRVFGSFLHNYITHRAVTVKARIKAVVFLWTGISVSIIFFTDSIGLRIFLGFIAVAVTIHLFLLKTCKD